MIRVQALAYGYRNHSTEIYEASAEALNAVNPVPVGKRWRSRKLHQHIAPGEAEKQFRQLLGECVGALTAAQSWDQFISIWGSMHPIPSLVTIVIINDIGVCFVILRACAARRET